ncbi:MAG: DUF262 domain-containing protein [Flavobacteriaceae bacterium]
MNEYKFEKLSFWQLLENRSVEIPIIQRDYAQGRAKKEKVRNDFLDALKNALTGNPVELDFVYGSEEKSVLQPLDGQQRLTTLFLLYWFIANKEGKLDEVKEHLLKFTYETRTSSREFCQELVSKSINYKNLLPINEEKEITIENQLSETIKNASWFVISWKNDPTISAMLIMLDAIQAKFKDSSALWQKLTETETPPITFLYIKLKNFGLSDDLYIKMNARGKALTPFENFKSRFEKHIKENGWEKEITNPQETFAHKIDTVWTDLFWKYKGDNNVIDDKLTEFIAGVAINYFAQKRENPERITRLARKEKKDNRIISYATEISHEDFSTKESFDYLVQCLKIYAQKDNDKFFNTELKTKICLWNYCKKNLFEEFIQYDDSKWQERTLFFAQTTYLLNADFDEKSFNDWIRVVRNIVENSTIDSATTFISAVNLIYELSKGCSNIYEYLSTNTVNAGHAQAQVKEEIEKAKIIIENPDAKQIIHDTEDTNFCKGRIDFALYCTDYDIEIPTVFDKGKLEKILSIITSNFVDMETKLSDDFKRAFLTIGSNDYYEVWRSWSHSFDSHKRWLLGKNNDLKEFSLRKDWYRDSLKELFIQLVNKGSFKQIIDDYVIPSNMPNWKQRLIKEENLLKSATFILIPNDNSYCKLAWQQKPSREDQVTKIK